MLHKSCNVLLVLCGLLGMGVNSAHSDLPELGQNGTESLSPSKESEIGQQVLSQLQAAHALLHDPMAQEYLENLGSRLVAASKLRFSAPINFFWVNEGSINAFALPGGFIGVHAGLILFAENENELAAVLAHELAHVQERHIAQLYSHLSKLQWRQIATTVAAVILAAGDHGNAATGLLAAGVASQMEAALSFTREHEAEADRLGLELLAKAGFSPAAMPLFFEHLDQQHRFQSQMPIFLRSHPFTKDRMEHSARLVAQYPSLEIQDSLAFQLIRARLALLGLKPSPENKRKLAQKYLNASDVKTAGLSYALALMDAQLGDTKQAIGQLQALIKTYPHETILCLSLAELYAADHQPKLAISLIQEHIRNPVASPLLTLFLAELLLQDNQAQACLKSLRDLELLSASTPPIKLFYLKAKAYAALKQPQESNLAQADYLWHQGLWQQSVARLEKVLKTSKPEELVYKQAQARLEELKDILPPGALTKKPRSTN